MDRLSDWTDEQTDGQRYDGMTERQTDRQTDGQMEDNGSFVSQKEKYF